MMSLSRVENQQSFMISARDEKWWKDAVIYHIYPRSFKDTSGNGVGDLNGITSQLDYLKDLGVDAIWVSPFSKSPMRDYGYDVEDYCAIDPLFGSMDDFDELVKAAKQRDIRLLMDLVFSHTSQDHEWFKQSRVRGDNPYHDYYVWADAKADGSPPTNWLSHFGGPAWSWDSKKGQYYLHNFLSTMPDLNVHNKEVQQELLNILRFWLNKGVSGFRLDVLDYYCHDPRLIDNPPATKTPKRFEPYLMQEHKYNRNHPEILNFVKKMREICNEYTDDEGQDVMMVAEISEAGGIEHSAIYTSSDDLVHTSYCFDFLSADFSPEYIRNIIETYRTKAPNGWPSWSFSNHDTVRVLSRWSETLGVSNAQQKQILAKLINALLISMMGTVYLYQGQELGLEDVNVPFEKMKDPYGIFQYPENKGRDGCRTPMLWSSKDVGYGFSSAQEAWLPYGEEASIKAVDIQRSDERSVLQFTKNLIALRNNEPLLGQNADMQFLYTNDNILLFERVIGDERCLCFFNLSDTSGTLPLDKLISAHTTSQVMTYQNITMDNNTITYKPFGFALIKVT